MKKRSQNRAFLHFAATGIGTPYKPFSTLHENPEFAFLCEKAKVKRIFHDLRRTAIRSLTLAGVPRETAKLISGDETDSIFERYSIINPEDTKKALGKVSLFGKSSTNSSTNDVFEKNERIQ